MKRDKVNALLAAILCTLAEVRDGEAPAGHLYAALMGECDLQTFQALTGILQRGGLTEDRGGCVIGITQKGRELAADIEAKARAAVAGKAGA